MNLRWEEQHDGESWWAYSGDIIVGMVVRQFDGKIAWSIQAVHMKWTAKGNGQAADFSAGKRALARAWSIWLGRAGLHDLAEKERT